MTQTNKVSKNTDNFSPALLRFLAPAQLDLLMLAGTASLGIDPTTKHSDELDLSEHNITAQLKENGKRLELIESALEENDLDVHDIFNSHGLPKVPLGLPVEVLDISYRSIKKLKRDGIQRLADLYRNKIYLDMLGDSYYVNRHVQNFVNESLFLLSLPILYKDQADMQTVLDKLKQDKEALKFGSNDEDDCKALMLPDVLIYRFHDDAYRSRLYEKEVQILDTVVWGNMRPDDAAEEAGIPGEGLLPRIIYVAGRKLIG